MCKMPVDTYFISISLTEHNQYLHTDGLHLCILERYY